MAMNFKTFADFEKWRIDNNVNMSQAEIDRMKETFGEAEQPKPEGNQAVAGRPSACTRTTAEKPKQHWAVTVIAIFLILIGGARMGAKTLKLFT